MQNLPQLPQKFGKYVLTELLARGGMAEIFRGRLEGYGGFSKEVVIKRILPQYSADPQFVAMFIDEACIAARLCHQNLVQIYDFGSVDEAYFIAMEYVPGLDLRAVLRRLEGQGQSLSFMEVAAIGEGVARGLHHAHTIQDEAGAALEVVHRDVSPHNIILCQNGEAKLADFGIAKARDRAAHTQTGAIKGKVSYMAPEQAVGDSLDARTDQYALGIVLWECLANRRLFQGSTPFAILNEVAGGRAPRLSQIVPDVPEGLAQVVDRMLAKEPSDRYPAMDDVRRALGEFRFTHGHSSGGEVEALVKRLRQPLGIVIEKEVESAATNPGRSDTVRAVGTMPLLDAELTQGVDFENKKTLTRREELSVGETVVDTLVAALSKVPMKKRVGVGLAAVVVVALGGEVALRLWDEDRSGPAGMSAVVNVEPKHVLGEEQNDGKLGEGHVRDANFLEHKELAAEVTAHSPPSPSNALLASISDRVKDKRQKTPTARKTQRMSRAGQGRLFLRTTQGWATVSLNGKVLGTTPLKNIPVSSGRHELVLKRPALDYEHKVVVEVQDGQVLKRTIRLP